MKAAFLFNFAKFVEWPTSAFRGDSTALHIAILGDDPFGPILDRIVENKTLNGRTFKVDRYLDMANIKNCQVLYIGHSQERWLTKILAQAQQKQILTVGESTDFLKAGGIIRLLTIGNKVRFEIEPEVAAASGLVISSRLLKLAENLRLSYISK